MGSVAAGWVLTGLALGLLMTGNPVAAFFVATVAVTVVVLAPETEREAARRRTREAPVFRPQARRVR